MGRKDIIAVACKIFGIYMLLQTLDLVSRVTVWHFGFYEGSWAARIALIFTFVLYAGVSYGLLMRSDAIADILAGREEGKVIGVALDRDSLMQVALVVVGIFLVADFLSFFPSAVGNISLKVPGQAAWYSWSMLVVVLTRLAIGAFLILGSRGLTRALGRLRQA